MMSESNAFDSLKLSSAVPYDHYKADVKNPPSTIIGDKHIATSPIYQEKYKHKIQEIINPDTLSKTTAYDSEVSPFSKEISSYIILPKIPGALSLSSNHPICLCIMASINLNLTFAVKFSAPMPKHRP